MGSNANEDFSQGIYGFWRVESKRERATAADVPAKCEGEQSQAFLPTLRKDLAWDKL